MINFSAKTFGISVAIALTVGFLIGFIPQHTSLATAIREKNQGQAQLARVQEEATLNCFKNRLAVVYVEAEKKTFAQASSDASSLFTAIQSFSERTSDGRVQLDLAAFLSQRDAIISGPKYFCIAGNQIPQIGLRYIACDHAVSYL